MNDSSPASDVTKNILASKTLWLNLLGPVFTFLATKYGLNLDPDSLAQVVLIIMGIANIVLRRFTSQPVTILPAKPQN